MRSLANQTKNIGTALAAVLLPASAAWAQEPAVPPQQAPVPEVTDPAPQAAEPVATPAPAAPASSVIERQLAEMMSKPGGLTADEAARRAVATSRDVRVKESEVSVAEAATDRVLYTSLPRLNLLARYTRLSPVGTQAFGPGSGALVATTDPPGPLDDDAPLIGIPASAFAFPEYLNQYLLQASLIVPLSDYLLSTPSAVDAANANERSARLNIVAAKLAAATQARLLYYEWVRARLQVVVAEKSIEQVRANLETAKVAFSAGRVSKADVLNAESLLASAELRAERARTQAAMAEERLRVLMHDPPEKTYEIGENLFRDPQPIRTQSFGQMLAEAKQKRVELKALAEASKSLDEQADVSEMRGVPKLEAFGNAYYSRPNQRVVPPQDEWRATWDVGVQLTWSPNDWGTSTTDTRSFQAERQKLMAQRQTVIDRIQEEILQAYTSLNEAEVGVATAQRNLAAAEESYRVQQLFYENGRGTSLELLEAETRLLQARIDLVNVRAAKYMAQVALRHALGRDVPSDAGR